MSSPINRLRQTANLLQQSLHTITMAQRPNITLYTDATPNGIKISMALEELGLDYKVEHVDISKNVQKEPWYLAINPNGRIPAMTDTFTDGQSVRLFESGSILQYLTEHYDPDHKISYPRGTREYHECNNWLWFQNAGLGPMQGQAHHFVRYAPEKIEYGMKRYINETRRLYRVLDDHLKTASSSGYLVGDHISIADITTIGWVIWAGWADVDIEEFPALKKWQDLIEARPAIQRGADIPKPMKIKELLKDKSKMDEYAKHSSKWVMDGMKGDSTKK